VLRRVLSHRLQQTVPCRRPAVFNLNQRLVHQPAEDVEDILRGNREQGTVPTAPAYSLFPRIGADVLDRLEVAAAGEDCQPAKGACSGPVSRS
jgi:hypothetical protein